MKTGFDLCDVWWMVRHGMKRQRWRALVLLLVLLGVAGVTVAQGTTLQFQDSGQRMGDRPANVVALGDIDGDGDLDALVGNSYPFNGEVWRNTGGGSFSDTGQSLGPTEILDIAIGDVDGDGDQDAIVVSGFNLEDYVYKNDGSGNFNATQSLGANSTDAVELGDLDNDGDLDAILLAYNQHTVWRNDGGVFVANGVLADGNISGKDVKLGDLDGDGDLDAVVAYFSPFDPFGRVWLNQGGNQGGVLGTFALGQQLAREGAFGWAQFGGGAVALLDYDGDGDLDIAKYGIWVNDGAATFTPDLEGPQFNDRSRGMQVGDIDRDGDPDIFESGGGSAIVLNQGLGVPSFASYVVPAVSGDRSGLGDLNGDGTLDVFLVDGANMPEPFGPNQVWFNVTPKPNNPPVAVDDYVVGKTDGGTTFTTTFRLLSNDFDPEGEPIVLQSFTQPGNGTLENLGGDLMRYTRTGGGSSPDSFSYTIANAAGRTEAAQRPQTSGSAWVLPDCACVVICLGSTRSQFQRTQAIDLELIYRLRDTVMQPTVAGSHYIDIYYNSTPEIARLLILEQTSLGAEAVSVVALWQDNLTSLVDGDGSATITQTQVDALETFLNNLSAAGSSELQTLIAAELTRLGSLDDYVGQTMAQAYEAILADQTTIHLPLVLR